MADASNPFGLTVGATVSAVGEYDDAAIPAAGPFNLAFDSNPTFSLTIELGSFTFVETDDDDFGGGFPRFQFADGILTGLDFERDGFSLPGFTDLTVGEFDSGTKWFLEDNVGDVKVLLEGTWDFANAVTEPIDTTPPDGQAVPEPTTWLLLATGLVGVGLLGYGRRSRRAISEI